MIALDPISLLAKLKFCHIGHEKLIEAYFEGIFSKMTLSYCFLQKWLVKIAICQLFASQMRYSENFKNWHIGDEKLIGVYFEVIFYEKTFSSWYGRKLNFGNLQFSISLRTRRDIRNFLKMAYKRREINGGPIWRKFL